MLLRNLKVINLLTVLNEAYFNCMCSALGSAQAGAIITPQPASSQLSVRAQNILYCLSPCYCFPDFVPESKLIWLAFTPVCYPSQFACQTYHTNLYTWRTRTHALGPKGLFYVCIRFWAVDLQTSVITYSHRCEARWKVKQRPSINVVLECSGTQTTSQNYLGEFLL